MNYTCELLSETDKLSNTEYRQSSQVDNSPYKERNINSAPCSLINDPTHKV